MFSVPDHFKGCFILNPYLEIISLFSKFQVLGIKRLIFIEYIILFFLN